MSTDEKQTDLFESDAARSPLDQLFSDSRLYTSSKDYKELLDFVVRLRNFAPFNAMLLQVQKPGLSYAASAHDWSTRFSRTIKEGARPLLFLWPFGSVALVYDEMDTEGDDLPEDLSFFPAHGNFDNGRIIQLVNAIHKKGIRVGLDDTGDRRAGSIRDVERPVKPDDISTYSL